MTAEETANAMIRVAEAIRRLGGPSWKHNTAVSEEAAVGAAGFLCFLRDCFTQSPKETWTQGEILVLLETFSRDAEIFPFGTGLLLWNLEEDDQP